MSNYATLLGSYRMSASTQVLPPPSRGTTTTSNNNNNNNGNYSGRYADGSYGTSAYYYDQCVSSSSSANRGGAAARVIQTSSATNNNSTLSTNSSSSLAAASTMSSRPRSSAPSTKSSVSSSSSYYQQTSTAANRNYYQQQIHQYEGAAVAPSTVPQTYLSTSSSNSSSSSSHYYYQQKIAQQQPPQQQQQQSSASSSSSSSSSAAAASILTQAQRTSGGSTSSKNATVINNAHHHRLRSTMYKPKWDPALPRTRFSHRPLLLLDLDETLVHATTQRPSAHLAHQHELHFQVDMGPNQAPVPVWVALRPGAKQFVYDIAAHFEIAVFTASIKNYADKVCEALDPSGTLIHHRLYRDHCSDVDGVFVKDLSLLNRPLHRVSILDNSPHAYLFHPENSIPILSWFDDQRDNELQKMLPMLIHQLSQADECYGVLERYRATL